MGTAVTENMWKKGKVLNLLKGGQGSLSSLALASFFLFVFYIFNPIFFFFSPPMTNLENVR